MDDIMKDALVGGVGISKDSVRIAPKDFYKMRLEQLNPILGASAYSGAQSLSFLCPLCRQRMVSIDIWAGKAGPLEYEPGKVIKLWRAEQGPNGDWATLSITPSIDGQHHKPSANGCTGWHGFITDGEAA